MKKNYLTDAFKRAAVYSAIVLSVAVTGLSNRANAQTRNIDSTEQGMGRQETKPWANDANYKAQLQVINVNYQTSVEKYQAAYQKSKANENKNYSRNLQNAAKNASRIGKSGNKLDNIIRGASSGTDVISIQARHSATLKALDASLDANLAKAHESYMKQVNNLDNKYMTTAQKQQQTAAKEAKQQQAASTDKTAEQADKLREQSLMNGYKKHLSEAEKQHKLPMTYDEYKDSLQKAQKKLPANRM